MKRREEFQVGPRALVDIDVRSGTVEVRTGSRDRVLVVLDGDDVDAWEVAQLGEMVSIRPGGRRGWRTRSVRVLVELPARSDLEVTTASADVKIVGEVGVARIRTASGDLRMEAVGQLDVSSASGDVRVGSVAADASCSSVSGDVVLGDVAGRLTVSTASGDVSVTSVGDDAEIGTASGDIRIDQSGGTSIDCKCISGDITVGLPAGIRVEPDISTLSGRTSLPAPSAKPQAGVDRRRVRVRLHTVSGNIAIERV